MSNMKGFARAQAQYEAREDPSYHEICGCECGDADCDDCTGEHGWIDVLVYVHRTKTHRARKDHFNKKGELLVSKGKKYIYSYYRQVTRDRNDGEIFAEVIIKKRQLREEYQ